MALNTLKSDCNHLYYNITIKANQQNKGIAVFDDNRTEEILKNPSDYEIAVLRFSVPSQIIPIFLWNDKKIFYITLEYNSILFYKLLVWFPNSPGGSFDYYGNAVWNYNDFINSINVGFKDCYDQLKVVYPAAPFTLPPKMVYNPITQLNSIYVEPSYESSAINPVKIWFNEALSTYFPAFQNFEGVIVDPLKLKAKHILIIKNLTNVATIQTIDYIYTEEEFTTLFLWSDFKTLIFETDLPVMTESQGAQTNKYRRILTDFEPFDNIADRSAIQYSPQGLPRFYDLVSSYPLNRVNLRVLWETKEGEFFPLRLNDFDILTVKLYFKRKGQMITF